MHTQCYFCYIKSLEKLITKFQPDNTTAIDLIFKVNQLLDKQRDLTNPYLVTKVQRLAREMLNTTDFYKKEKNEANQMLLNQYGYWKDKIHTSKNPFHTAAKLAVVGNIIDYGAHCVSDNINKQIEDLYALNLTLDETDSLYHAIKKAKSILYLGDNAGEIVFDKLFIEQMEHPNVTFAVRGTPVINDITTDDAEFVNMQDVAKVISNGYDAPSTIVESCSNQFQNIYQSADLIISKGQGNFEGLMDRKHKNTFFMLIAKCEIIANYLGVEKGNLVVTQIHKK